MSVGFYVVGACFGGSLLCGVWFCVVVGVCVPLQRHPVYARVPCASLCLFL